MRGTESRLTIADRVLLLILSREARFSVRFENQVVSIFATMIWDSAE